MPDSRRPSISFLVFALVFLAGAYTYNGHAWNQISRYDAIFAYVEPGPGHGTFRIDRFILDPQKGRNTGDWANNPRHDTHYYSNKAPGPIFLGIALYAPLFHLERAAGSDPTRPAWTRINCYLLNLGISVLPLAIAALAFLALLRRLGHLSESLDVALTLLLALGTLVLPYATQLWGHTTAAALVIFGIHALVARRFAWSGFWLGWGVLCEYSVALVLAAVAVVLLLRESRGARTRWLAGGAIPLLLFAAYHDACFGRPWAMASGYSNPLFRDPEGLWGVFRLDVVGDSLWGLTFSRYRGLFWSMPVLLASLVSAVALPLIGSSRAWRELRWLYALAAGTVVAFLAWNVFFNGWWGGNCVGPRYQIPVLPLYALLSYLGLAEIRSRRAFPGRRLVLALAIALASGSMANMLVVSAVSPVARRWNPERPETAVWRDPISHHYGLAWRGDLQPFRFHPIRRARLDERAQSLGSFNLGELAGLSGRASLLPLGAITLICLGGIAATLWPRRRNGALPPRD